MQPYFVHPSGMWTSSDNNHVAMYIASEVHDQLQERNERITDLQQQLAGANQTIALFMGPDGEKHIERFAEVVRFARLKCWWHGHAIVASIDFHPTCPRYIYHCSRCKRVLPGPC